MINTYESTPDKKLVGLAQAGDSAAYEELCCRYKSMVRLKSRPYYILGADREDIVQEGMIGLFKAVRDYSDDKSATFKTFAELCIVRQIITAIQSASRQKHQPLNTYVSLSTPIAGDDHDRTLIDVMPTGMHMNPEEIVISNESLDVFMQGLKDSLTELEYEVLMLFINGMSYQEIAEKLGKRTKTIDNALLEAAYIDGAGDLRVYWSIILPLSKSAIATVAIIGFIGNWNSYMWPKVVATKESLRTVQTGLRMLMQSDFGDDWGSIMAAATLITMPMILFFVCLQRYFVQGITKVGLK